MIWGHDDSAQLLVNLIILIAILSVHFVKLYLKRKSIRTKMSQIKIKNKTPVYLRRAITWSGCICLLHMCLLAGIALFLIGALGIGPVPT